MGYQIWLRGSFLLTPPLKIEHKAYLQRFAEIPHGPLKEERIRDYPDPLRELVGLPIGKDGMYFTGSLRSYDDLNSPVDEIVHAHGPSTEGFHEMCEFAQGFHVINAHWHKIAAGLGAHPISVPEVWMPSSTFCQWVPTYHGQGLQAEGEKFTGYSRWLEFLLEHFFLPWGYELSGTVTYQGEEGEHGRLLVKDQHVTVIVDGDSLLSRFKEEPGSEPWMETYWITVGAVSEAARKELLAAGCIVKDIHADPPVVLVGLRHDRNYYKRHGHDDLAIWTSDGIALRSRDLHLYWNWDENSGGEGDWGGVPAKKLQLANDPEINLPSPLKEEPFRDHTF